MRALVPEAKFPRMKTVICLLTVLSFAWLVAESIASDERPVVLVTPPAGKFGEGMLFEMDKKGKLVTDSGRHLESLEAVETFITGDGKMFVPQVIVPAKLETKEAYDFLFAVLLMLEKHKMTYSLMIEVDMGE